MLRRNSGYTGKTSTKSQTEQLCSLIWTESLLSLFLEREGMNEQHQSIEPDS